MKKTAIIMAILLVLSFSAMAYAQDGVVRRAQAGLKDVNGTTVGYATFTEDGKGVVHINVLVKGLPPGKHGIHIHEVGSCTPNFSAAGEHFNPMGKKHGLNNTQGAHAGDLPNLEVNKAGIGRLSTKTDMITLSPGNKTIFDNNGSALVIHAGPDDQMTDPTGNSGGRIACGVIAVR